MINNMWAGKERVELKLKNIDPSLMKEFRYVLQEHGFSSKEITAKTKELPGVFLAASAKQKVYDYLFSSNKAQSLLIKFFLSNTALTKKELLSVFDIRLVSFLMDLGIIKKKLFNYYAPIFLFPYLDMYFITDRLGPADAVFQLDKEQNIFANSIIPKRKKNTLDLCTGSGIFAILASRFSDTVTAVDINPRAILFTGFNAILNDVKNVTCMQGDIFQPLGQQEFDLILANPPYNPFFGGKKTLSLHAGPGGEDVLFKIFRGLLTHLKQDGICQIISRYFYKQDLSYYERIKNVIDVDKFNIFLLQSYPREIFTLSNMVKTSWSVRDVYALFDFYKNEKIDRESYGVLTFSKVAAHGTYSEKAIDFDQWLDHPIWPIIEKSMKTKSVMEQTC